MTAVGLTAGATPPVTKRGEWAKWGGISGIVFGPLLVVATTLASGMPSAKNAAKVQAWAVKHTGILQASAVISVVAVVVGLYFLTWLHSRFAEREPGWFTTMFLVGMAIFAAGGGLAAGIDATIGTDAKHLSASSLQLLGSLWQNFNFPMTCAGLAVMYLAAGFLIRRTRVLPGWLAWVSWLFALTAASDVLGFIALFGTVLWVIVVGIITTVRRPVEG